MRWSPDGRFGIWDLLVILLVAGVAVGLGLHLWGNLPGGTAEAVLVTQDGQEIDRVPLTKEVQSRVYSGRGSARLRASSNQTSWGVPFSAV